MIYDILSNKYMVFILTLIWIGCILSFIIQFPEKIENVIKHLYGIFIVYICGWCLFILYLIDEYLNTPEEPNINYLRL